MSSESFVAVDSFAPRPSASLTLVDEVETNETFEVTNVYDLDDTLFPVLELLSAGQTPLPNRNYLADTAIQPAHNTRVSDPYYLLNPSLSSKVPVHVKPHSRLVLTDVEDRTFFDYFAWQSFIGLVWPSDPNNRGVADPSVVTAADFLTYNTNAKKNNNPAPVVWESFRTFDAAFPRNAKNTTATPDSWDAVPYTRPFALDFTSKSELDEASSYPLVDQNREYVRYNLQLNEVMYEFIRQNKWYLKENLPKSPTQATLPPLPIDTATGKIISVQQPQTNTIITQPVNGNSITIKSSWRLMITEKDPARPYKHVDDLTRYFVSDAMVKDPITNVPSLRKVGLVGIHIVVKTPQFTQGVWSSFEHVDNVKLNKSAEMSKLVTRPSFNSGESGFQSEGFSYRPASLAAEGAMAVEEALRVPVEVSRIYKIPNTPVGTSPTLPDGLSTQGLNKAYQKLLEGTVWANYELVITQWPTDPTSFYAKPFLTPRGPKPAADQPYAVQAAYERAQNEAELAYPRWSGLPVPQTGCLNTTMETYSQNPAPGAPDFEQASLESTSCMGCHYDASDTDFSWAFKLRTYPQNPKSYGSFPQGFDQGRIHQADTDSLRSPANVK
ncbi:MAG: hypothetical protein ACJA0U_001861 [Salibacteraceae bacterium]|jgi:hypothetical protein